MQRGGSVTHVVRRRMAEPGDVGQGKITRGRFGPRVTHARNSRGQAGISARPATAWKKMASVSAA